MVTFEHPSMIILSIGLIPVFLLMSAIWYRYQKLYIGRFGNRETLAGFSTFSRKTIPSIIFSLALAAMATSAAEPIFSSHENASTPTLNAIIVMDVSRSMFAEDGLEGKSRLETGIVAIEELFGAYPDGRFGLVIYTGRTARYRPTTDQQAIKVILLDILENYSVQGKGSEPINALHHAGELIEESPYTIDTIILISDGGQSITPNIGRADLITVVEELRSRNINLVIAGVGDFVPTSIPVYDDQGELTGYYQYQGTTAYTSLDEISLKRIASEASGWYVRINDLDDLIGIVRSKNLDSQPTAQPTSTNFAWIPALVSNLLIVLWLLRLRKSS